MMILNPECRNFLVPVTMASAAKVFGATLAMHNRCKAMPPPARVVTSAFDGCKR